jgi:hypothetical protein
MEPFVNERQDEESPGLPQAGPAMEQTSDAPPPETVPSRARRPWRWVLGALSIAAVSAGVIFITKRGFRKE